MINIERARNYTIVHVTIKILTNKFLYKKIY